MLHFLAAGDQLLPKAANIDRPSPLDSKAFGNHSLAGRPASTLFLGFMKPSLWLLLAQATALPGHTPNVFLIADHFSTFDFIPCH